MTGIPRKATENPAVHDHLPYHFMALSGLSLMFQQTHAGMTMMTMSATLLLSTKHQQIERHESNQQRGSVHPTVEVLVRSL